MGDSKMKIRNIDLKKLEKKLVLCTGAVILGTMITGCAPEKEVLTDSEGYYNSEEQLQKDYAKINYNCKNTESLAEPDFLAIGESDGDGLNDGFESNEKNFHDFVSPGRYRIYSDVLGEKEFEIDDKNKDYIVNIDYETKEMTLEKVDEENKVK